MKKHSTHIISIDPGLGGTGYAIWRNRVAPVRVGIVRDSARDESLPVRCWELMSKLHSQLGSVTGLWDIYIEMPQAMSNAKGIAAQAGAVYKLTFLVGYLSASFLHERVHLVQPVEWKGQLPKDVVQRRIEQRLGMGVCRQLGIKTHAWDAVGIGLWALGRF